MCTFADVGPPDVLERARATAVDALGLVRTDDDVLDHCARFQDEHSVVLASLGLALALSGASLAVVHLHSAVEGTGDDGRSRQGHIAAGSGQRGCEACNHEDDQHDSGCVKEALRTSRRRAGLCGGRGRGGLGRGSRRFGSSCRLGSGSASLGSGGLGGSSTQGRSN